MLSVCLSSPVCCLLCQQQSARSVELHLPCCGEEQCQVTIVGMQSLQQPVLTKGDTSQGVKGSFCGEQWDVSKLAKFQGRLLKSASLNATYSCATWCSR